MIVFQLALLAIALLISVFALMLSLSFFFGAPFVTTPKKIVSELIALARLRKNDVLADLGSGDGRILLGAAKICKKAVGYEINPFLALWSKIMSILLGVEDKVEVNWKNYKNADLKNVTVVVLYSIRGHVPALEKKLKGELNSGTKIVSYKFPLTKFTLVKKTKSNIYLYAV